MASLNLCNLKRAAEDFRLLLNKGYPRKRSLELVGDRFKLNKDQRHLLARGIFSETQSKSRFQKLISITQIKGKKLGVDGHNVLITVESALYKKPLVFCDDGLMRDIAGVSHNFKITQTTKKALRLILTTLKRFKVREVHFFFDAPISRSGELAKLVRESLKKYLIKGSAKAVRVPERELANYKIIATSDSALIDTSKRTLDLAGYLIKKTKNQYLICRPEE